MVQFGASVTRFEYICTKLPPMADNNKYFVEPGPFDCREISDYPETIFDTARETAETHLEAQAQHLSGIESRCVTLLGWLLAAISGLVGYIAVSLSGLNDTRNIKLLVIALLALLVFSAAAGVLIKSNLYKRSSYLPGVDPDLLFHKDLRGWIEQHYPKEEWAKMTKGCYLQTLQDHIIYNNEEIAHRVKGYRTSLWIILYGLLSLLISSIAISLF